MVTPSTLLVNVLEKTRGWHPVTCSHDEMIALMKKVFIDKANSAEELETIKKASKGAFMRNSGLKSSDGIYELTIQAAAHSTGQRICIFDNERMDLYQRDYAFVKKFAKAVEEECDIAKQKLIMGEKGVVTNSITKDINASKCPVCGKENPIEGKFCTECGAKLESKRECPNCHNKLEDGVNFCPECGAAV